MVALAYADGVLFVAENPSRLALQKVSEIYDWSVSPRSAGSTNSTTCGVVAFSTPTPADTPGDRRDVTGRQLANVYAQTLGTIFTEQAALRGRASGGGGPLRRGQTAGALPITYDGSIADEPHFVVMGGTTEPIINALKGVPTRELRTGDAVGIAVGALRSGISTATGNSTPAVELRVLGPSTLEVAVLDASRP